MNGFDCECFSELILNEVDLIVEHLKLFIFLSVTSRHGSALYLLKILKNTENTNRKIDEKKSPCRK